MQQPDWKDMLKYLSPLWTFWNTFSNESLQCSHSVVSDSWWPHGLRHSRLPCPSPTPEACSNSCPSSRDAVQSSRPLSSPSPPAFNLSQNQGLFQWVSSSHQVAKVLFSLSILLCSLAIYECSSLNCPCISCDHFSFTLLFLFHFYFAWSTVDILGIE